MSKEILQKNPMQVVAPRGKQISSEGTDIDPPKIY